MEKNRHAKGVCSKSISACAFSLSPLFARRGEAGPPPRVAYLNSKVLSQTRFTACDGPENCVYHCLLLLSWPKRRANATADCARK